MIVVTPAKIATIFSAVSSLLEGFFFFLLNVFTSFLWCYYTTYLRVCQDKKDNIIQKCIIFT
nr:MAG TPA: hypothetical protein [Caudoviricetes sp.]